MKYAAVLLAALAFVQADPINRAGWSTTAAPGWSTEAPTTGWTTTLPPTSGWTTTLPPTSGWTTTLPPTSGWTTTAPPTTTKPGWGSGKDGWTSSTTGWPSTEPPTTQGWSTSGWSSPPTTAGWGAAPSNVNINLDAALAAQGSGWAGENHQDAVDVSGGWGQPASISIAASGDSVVDQSGAINQLTNIDGENASSINLADVSQLVDAQENVALAAAGLDVNFAQSGWAAAAGEGNLASNAASLLLANLGNH